VTVYPIGGAVARYCSFGGRCEVEVGDAGVSVRMGRLFSSLVPREAITGARPTTTALWRHGIGVHAVRGGWVVNGRTGAAIELTFDRPVRISVLGVPWRTRRLVVGVDDPESLAAELTAASA